MAYDEWAQEYDDGMAKHKGDYRRVLTLELAEIIRDNKTVAVHLADGSAIHGTIIGADAFCLKVRHSDTEGDGDTLRVTNKITLAMLDQVTTIMRTA